MKLKKLRCITFGTAVQQFLHVLYSLPMISLKNVTVMRRGKPVLNGVSLQIKPKECLCIVSDEQESLASFFRVLATLEKPAAGTVDVDNVDVSVLPEQVLQLFRSRVGLVFHPPVSVSHLTVGQNISLPLHLRGVPASVITKATDDLLKRCGLASKVSLFPKDLSPEEIQMMCIARCVITAPLVIVAYDPFLGLSEKNAAAAASLFQNLCKKGSTLIFLSATTACATTMGAPAIVLKNGTLELSAPVIQRPSPAAMEESSVYTPSAPKRAMEEETMVPIIQKPMPPRTPGTIKEARKIHITSIGSGLS